MKKSLMVVLIVVIVSLLSGCDMLRDQHFGDLASDHELYYLPEFDDLNSYDKISDWMEWNVRYKFDSNDYWQNPEYTLKRGYGDCEDFSLLFANIAYFGMGIKMDIILVNDETVDFKQIVNGGKIDHVMLYYNDEIICPFFGDICTGTVGYLYSFDYCFQVKPTRENMVTP